MGRAYQNRKESMAKTSDMKAKVYSRYGREIYVSAKSGGVDPIGNLALRNLIDRAKKDQVPAHVIDKAIDKAKGGGGEDYSPARYEGYGPGGSMAIIECLTDNPNRTFGDVRLAFTKTKCKIGSQGSVSHMFDHLSIFVFNYDDEDTVLEALMDANTVTISKLMEIAPVGTVDPTAGIYTTTMYACSGLLGLALLSNAAIGPVDPKHHMEKDKKGM